MIIIGIDPSINCTGICVYDTNKNDCEYFMIIGKLTKKLSSFKHNKIHICNYDKKTYTDDIYSVKEQKKTQNIINICNYIKHIIQKYNPEIVYMEGISYGSTSSSALVDLAGLNYCIRNILLECNINFEILSPTSVKKFAVGNGGVEKDVMIASWKKLDKNISKITDIKLDDLADSYFIAHYS